MEYCRQRKNNGVKGRAAPGREALGSENAITKREPTRLKNNETSPTDRQWWNNEMLYGPVLRWECGGRRRVMWLPIWAGLICLAQRNRQVMQCSCETVLSAVLPILQVTLLLFYLLFASLTLSSSLSLSVCLLFNPAHLITPFEGGPGLHEYIISSLDRPKELSYKLWDEVSGLQNEFSHQQTAWKPDSCRCIFKIHMLNVRVCVSVSLFFPFF